MFERTAISDINKILKGAELYKSQSSPIEIAKRELVISEKRIILTSEFAPKESEILKTENIFYGGII